MTLLRWFIQTIPLEIFTLSALVLAPFGYFFPKTFNWYLDDEINNSETNKDYKIWLAGRRENFYTFYLWHGLRNRMWNFRRKFRPEQCRLILTDVRISELYRNGKQVPATETASYKWIDALGNEGWQVNRGVRISEKYSTIGTTYIFFKVNGKKYFRFSTAREVKIFGKTYYLTIKLGTN